MSDTPERYAHLAREFDIDDPLFATEFENVLDHLVAQCPVAHSSVGPGYRIFNRYREVRRCAQDWRIFSSASHARSTSPCSTVRACASRCSSSGGGCSTPGSPSSDETLSATSPEAI